MIKITVPEYYNRFIDKKVDLDETPKVCCPFHQEDTPSFSYDSRTGKWRCFGACKTGGDVIKMHQINFKLKTRQEAEKSLCSLLGIPYREISNINQLKQHVDVNEEQIELERLYHLCCLYAEPVNRFLELCQVMSIYPVDVLRLKQLLKEWGIEYES